MHSAVCFEAHRMFLRGAEVGKWCLRNGRGEVTGEGRKGLIFPFSFRGLAPRELLL
jgi:hypothetical protein